MIFQTFGDVRYDQISSPQLEERIRSRYKSEIDQLISLGFIYRFSVGQTIPIISFIFVVPAIVLLMMLWRREVITLRHGKEFLIANAIYARGNITAFAQPMGLGIVFETAFQYGSGVTTANFGSSNSPKWGFQRQALKGASISETWVAHQRLVRSRIANGAEIDCETSFKAYVSMNS